MNALQYVLFDAGGTIVELDYGHLRDVLTQVTGNGAGIGDEQFESADRGARAWWVDQLRGGAAPLDAWNQYFRRVYEGVGVREPATGEAIRRLWSRNIDSGLWHRPAAGAAAMLARLRASGLRLAVVSNAEGRVAKDLAIAGLEEHFETIVDSHHVGFSKPDRRIFVHALERMGARPEESVFVGDIYDIDVKGARAAGLPAVLVDRWRLHPESDCPRVESLEALEDLLLREVEKIWK